jgi:hypothetical protein
MTTVKVFLGNPLLKAVGKSKIARNQRKLPKPLLGKGSKRRAKEM